VLNCIFENDEEQQETANDGTQEELAMPAFVVREELLAKLQMFQNTRLLSTRWFDENLAVDEGVLAYFKSKTRPGKKIARREFKEKVLDKAPQHPYEDKVS
jgi:hypothetical protein